MKPQEQKNTPPTVDNTAEGGIIKIEKSVGAKAKNYTVKLPNGEYTQFTEGTRITDIKTIAGKGRARQIDEIEVLLE